jgi:hypothetical protein
MVECVYIEKFGFLGPFDVSEGEAERAYVERAHPDLVRKGLGNRRNDPGSFMLVNGVGLGEKKEELRVVET